MHCPLYLFFVLLQFVHYLHSAMLHHLRFFRLASHLKGCELRLHHVCQGGYVAMHEIELDGAEPKICREYVENLWLEGNPGKLKMVQHSTV